MGRVEDILSLETFLDIPPGGNRGVSPNYLPVEFVGETICTVRIDPKTLEITRVDETVESLREGNTAALRPFIEPEPKKDQEGV